MIINPFKLLKTIVNKFSVFFNLIGFLLALLLLIEALNSCTNSRTHERQSLILPEKVVTTDSDTGVASIQSDASYIKYKV